MHKKLLLIGCSALFLSSDAVAQQNPQNQKNPDVQQFQQQFNNHRFGLSPDTTAGIGMKPAKGYGASTTGYKGSVSGVGIPLLGSMMPVKKCATPLYINDKQCVD